MASDSLSQALDALEAALDASEGAGPDESAAALAQPVKVFDEAAKEALR